jgi:hypothetical protein
MAGARSLSASQITAAAKKTVAKVAEKNRLLLGPNVICGFVPPWWWIGLILQHDGGLESIEDAQNISGAMHEGISAAVPAFKSANPGTIIDDGRIICGFFPPPGVLPIEE